MRRRLMMAMGMEDEEVKEWNYVASIDFSQMANANAKSEEYSIQASEILIIWNDVGNSSALDSTVPCVLNGENFNIPMCRSGKSGTALSGYTRVELLKGIGTFFEISAGAFSKNNDTYNAGLYVPFNLIPMIDEYKTLQIRQPSTQYFATSGTLKIYAR